MLKTSVVLRSEVSTSDAIIAQNWPPPVTATMNELDRLLADLKRHSARSVGLTYAEVVMLDDVMSALERVQGQSIGRWASARIS